MAKDVKMYYIEDDIKKIQTKSNLYLREYGPGGVFHMAREIIQNNIDECIDPESNGKLVNISYDKKSGILTCEDDGRGFPEKDLPLDIFCTKNQSGSKFFRNQGGDSSGEFGIGLTVVNALSDYFTMTSYREKENTQHTIKFAEGDKTDDKKTKLKGTKKHGSVISFHAAEKFLGKGAELPFDEMLKWIETQMYFIKKKGFKIVVDLYDGMKLEKSYKLSPKPFGELLDMLSGTSNYSPVMDLTGSKTLTERIHMSVINPDTGSVETEEADVEKKMTLEVSLRYIDPTTTDGADFDSYCNFTHTPDGGVHQDAVEKSYCNYMMTKVKATMSDAQKEKYGLTWEDIRSGLCCVLYLSSSAQVGFVGNAKTRIGNKALLAPLRDIVTEQLEEFFKKNPSVFNTYANIIKLNAKTRVEAAKIRTATKVEHVNNFKEHEMNNFIPCINKGKKWKEIFLVEGKSPAGSARNGCDPMCQSFFLFRGVPANAFTRDLATIMDNPEWKTLVTLLRCGIGKDFDINKLYYDRINIFTDADVDGFYISLQILGFFFKFLPGVIEAGKLYKVFTPLYALEDKEHPFVADKREMTELFHKKIGKRYEVRLEGDEKPMKKSEMKEFLMDTYDYRDIMIGAADNAGKVDKGLIEIIVAYLVGSGAVRSREDFDDIGERLEDRKFVKFMMTNIQKKYPEIILDKDKRFVGVANGHNYIVKPGARLIHNIGDIIPVFQKYGLYINVSEKGGEERRMTICEFLDICQKDLPKIKRRYKGLGEFEGDEMYDVALNIQNRISVRYTMESAEKDLEQLSVLLSQRAKYPERRKQMMKEYKINKEDLDN